MSTSPKTIISALTLIYDKTGRVLITKRYEPERGSLTHDKWQLPGGGIEFGESSSQAAIREALEEVGLQVEIVDPRPVVMTHTYFERDYQIVLIAYQCRSLNGTQVTLNEESSDYRWIDPDTIGQLECLPKLPEMIAAASKLFNQSS